MKEHRFSNYYKDILEKAVEAGEKALYSCAPRPVNFFSADIMGNPLDEGRVDPEGNCGGAYITGISGHDAFVKWAKQHEPRIVQKGVYKGYDIIGLTSRMKVSYRGQSADRYEAFARAAAKVLNDNGIKCSVKAYLT